MGRGDSSWQDRNHHIGKPRGDKKTSTSKTTPTVDTSVGTEGYDDTKATTAFNPLETLRLVRVS